MYNEKDVYTLMYCYFVLKLSITEIKKRTTAHLATLYRWINKYEHINWENSNKIHLDFDKINKIKRKSYFKKCKSNVVTYVKWYMEKHKFINIKYIIKQIKRKYKIDIQKSSIYKIIKKLDYTHKRVKVSKVLKINKKKHEREVEKFKRIVNTKINEKKEIYSIDESSFYINMLDEYGWSKKGTDCIHMPKSIARKRFSLLLVISKNSVIDYKIYEGSVNGSRFYDFFKNLDLSDNKFMILDNFRGHKTKVIKKDKNYNKLLFNVPYCPETNPIEMAFSKIKSYVKKRDNSTIQKLYTNIEKGIKKLRKRDLKNYFKKSFC